MRSVQIKTPTWSTFPTSLSSGIECTEGLALDQVEVSYGGLSQGGSLVKEDKIELKLDDNERGSS